MDDDSGVTWNSFLLLFGVGLLSFILYMTPSILAYNKRHPQLTPILILNILTGFTGFGWVAALVWVFIVPTERPASAPEITTITPANTALNSGSKDCPSCAETVKLAAVKCRFCGHEFA